ncbi:hypothetical protein POI8812_02264 [Pontivivens insulae]|uniref:Uncharacterized protein n=1 Tax=Pontivivens insulae TaxID=1639689 RepID=A0A2R8AD25_9RHOB|nr:hypothetical protein DFR53_1210 [Pontivivens insulae]SPF29938.1 hypothetical protein POI8812_02264 [Pontivivens insulae]
MGRLPVSRANKPVCAGPIVKRNAPVERFPKSRGTVPRSRRQGPRTLQWGVRRIHAQTSLLVHGLGDAPVSGNAPQGTASPKTPAQQALLRRAVPPGQTGGVPAAKRGAIAPPLGTAVLHRMAYLGFGLDEWHSAAPDRVRGMVRPMCLRLATAFKRNRAIQHFPAVQHAPNVTS